MSVLRHSCGRLRGEGRGTDQKQHCDRWWRLNGTMPGGATRTRHAVQPQTDINGKTMSKPYVPLLLTGFFFNDSKVN